MFHTYIQATMTSPDLLGSKNRMEDITLDKLDKSDLKAVLVTMYDHNRYELRMFACGYWLTLKIIIMLRAIY